MKLTFVGDLPGDFEEQQVLHRQLVLLPGRQHPGQGCHGKRTGQRHLTVSGGSNKRHCWEEAPLNLNVGPSNLLWLEARKSFPLRRQRWDLLKKEKKKKSRGQSTSTPPTFHNHVRVKGLVLGLCVIKTNCSCVLSLTIYLFIYLFISLRSEGLKWSIRFRLTPC